jgi:hypothetical protein
MAKQGKPIPAEEIIGSLLEDGLIGGEQNAEGEQKKRRRVSFGDRAGQINFSAPPETVLRFKRLCDALPQFKTRAQFIEEALNLMEREHLSKTEDKKN